MSYEFKMIRSNRGRKDREEQKYNRNKNKNYSGTVPMRRGNSENFLDLPYVSFKEIKGFLKSRVNKPIDEVFSEFQEEMKKHLKINKIKDLFNSYVSKDKETMNINRNTTGFYIKNGVLKYKKIVQHRSITY